MSISSTTVHGPLYSPGLIALQDAKIIFDLTSWDADPDDNIFVTGPFVADVDEQGNFTVTLFTNTNGINNTVYEIYVSYIDQNTKHQLYNPRIKKFIGTVSLTGSGPFYLSDLNITSDYAPGSFDLYTIMLGLVNSAETYADEAKDSANQVENLTAIYGISLVQLMELSEGTVQDLLDNTTLNPATLLVGLMIQVGKFWYEVAALDATDHNLTTAGGVKLYYLPNGSIDPRALGAKMDVVPRDVKKLDENGDPVLDENGNPVLEKEYSFAAGDAPVSNWDASAKQILHSSPGTLIEKNGVTDDAEAWQEAAKMSSVLGMPIEFYGYSYSTKTIGTPEYPNFTIVGKANVTSKNAIYFGPGAGIYQAMFDKKNPNKPVSLSGGMHDNFRVIDARPARSLKAADFSGNVTQTGEDSPLNKVGWDTTPLIIRGRGSHFTATRVEVVGGNYRHYGAIYGGPFNNVESVIWNSQWEGCQYTQCAIGRIIGCGKDSTGIGSEKCTIHHNLWAGDVLVGIHGGSFNDIVEHNEGPWGRVYLGWSTATTSVSEEDTYMFNNGEFHAGKDDTASLRIGKNIPGTVFETLPLADQRVTHITVKNGYIVSDHTMRCIDANLFRTSEIENIRYDHHSTGEFMRLSGNSPLVKIDGNYQQGSPGSLGTVSGGTYRRTVFQDSGTGMARIGGEMQAGSFVHANADDSLDKKARIQVFGDPFTSSTEWLTLEVLTGNPYAEGFIALVNLWQSDNSSKQSYVVHGSVYNVGSCNIMSAQPTGILHSAKFRVFDDNGTKKFQCNRSENYRAFSVMFMGGQYT